MKKFISNVAVITVTAFILQACCPGGVMVEEEITFNGVSKEDIYKKANNWFSDNFSIKTKSDAKPDDYTVTYNVANKLKDAGFIRGKAEIKHIIKAPEYILSASKALQIVFIVDIVKLLGLDEIDFIGRYSLGTKSAENQVKILTSVDGMSISLLGFWFPLPLEEPLIERVTAGKIEKDKSLKSGDLKDFMAS